MSLRVRPFGLAAALGLAVTAAGASGAGVASAQPRAASIELSVIFASRTDADAFIDPQLRDLPQLTRDQPFVRYNVYKLLDRQRLPIEAGKTVSYPLVNGRTVSLGLAGVTQPDAGGPRYQVAAHIGETGKDAYLKDLQVTASANQPFFVGGQSYQGGTLFVEMVVRP